MTDKDLAVRIGSKLRELRGIRTQVGVAKALGIHQNSLVNYEKGRRIPPDPVKQRICEYFGCDVTIFYPDKNNEKL